MVIGIDIAAHFSRARCSASLNAEASFRSLVSSLSDLASALVDEKAMIRVTLPDLMFSICFGNNQIGAQWKTKSTCGNRTAFVRSICRHSSAVPLYCASPFKVPGRTWRVVHITWCPNFTNSVVSLVPSIPVAPVTRITRFSVNPAA